MSMQRPTFNISHRDAPLATVVDIEDRTPSRGRRNSSVTTRGLDHLFLTSMAQQSRLSDAQRYGQTTGLEKAAWRSTRSRSLQSINGGTFNANHHHHHHDHHHHHGDVCVSIPTGASRGDVCQTGGHAEGLRFISASRLDDTDVIIEGSSSSAQPRGESATYRTPAHIEDILSKYAAKIKYDRQHHRNNTTRRQGRTKAYTSANDRQACGKVSPQHDHLWTTRRGQCAVPATDSSTSQLLASSVRRLWSSTSVLTSRISRNVLGASINQHSLNDSLLSPGSDPSVGDSSNHTDHGHLVSQRPGPQSSARNDVTATAAVCRRPSLSDLFRRPGSDRAPVTPLIGQSGQSNGLSPTQDTDDADSIDQLLVGSEGNSDDSLECIVNSERNRSVDELEKASRLELGYSNPVGVFLH